MGKWPLKCEKEGVGGKLVRSVQSVTTYVIFQYIFENSPLQWIKASRRLCKGFKLVGVLDGVDDAL